jgi:hypothetical protein
MGGCEIDSFESEQGPMIDTSEHYHKVMHTVRFDENFG